MKRKMYKLSKRLKYGKILNGSNEQNFMKEAH